jgi:hypothetical protein
MRIAVCVPSRDEVKTGFCFALAALLQACQYDLIPMNERGPEVAKLRNRLVRKAMLAQCDSILWIDSDIVVPPHFAERLIDHDRDIVGCTYAAKSQLHAQNDSPAFVHEDLPVTHHIENSGVREVARLPGGALLVRASVYEAIADPWYEAIKETPEDWALCDKARDAGFPVFLDSVLSSQVLHLGEYAYGSVPCS